MISSLFKNKISLVVPVCLLFFIACENMPTKLKMHNNGNSSIFATFGMNLIIPPTVDYPLSYFIENQIPPHQTGPVKSWIKVENWENFIDKCVDKKIYVFVFSIDTIKKYGYMNSALRVKYIKKYSYSKIVLDSMNWIIDYKNN